MYEYVSIFSMYVCSQPYLADISSEKEYSISEMGPKAKLNTELFFYIDFWKHYTTNAIEIDS